MININKRPEPEPVNSGRKDKMEKFFKVLRRETKQMIEIKTSDISFEDKLRKLGWYRTRLMAYIDLGYYIGLITLNTYKILFRNIMKIKLIE